MNDFPRARFLPRNPIVIEKRSSRQRRDEARKRPWWRQWLEALFWVGLVLFGLVGAFWCAWSALVWGN